MSKLPVIPYRRLKKIAEVAGFTWTNCEGSHNTFRTLAGKSRWGEAVRSCACMQKICGSARQGHHLLLCDVQFLANICVVCAINYPSHLSLSEIQVRKSMG